MAIRSPNGSQSTSSSNEGGYHEHPVANSDVCKQHGQRVGYNPKIRERESDLPFSDEGDHSVNKETDSGILKTQEVVVVHEKI